MNWNFLQTLRGSFSAVSTPVFASKYSLESSWRDLKDLHTFAPLRSQNFSQNSSTFFREWINEFPIFSRAADEWLPWKQNEQIWKLKTPVYCGEGGKPLPFCPTLVPIFLIFHRFQNFRQVSTCFRKFDWKSDTRHSFLEFVAKSGQNFIKTSQKKLQNSTHKMKNR